MSPGRLHGFARRPSGLVLCAALAGCAVGPDFVKPEAPKGAQVVAPGEAQAPVTAGGQTQRFVPGQRLQADWWRLFSNPEVSEMVADALAHNMSLEAGRASLRQSQDSLRAGYGVFFPQVNASFGVSRQQSNPAPGAVPSNTYSLATASGNVSYVVDIWGGERRQIEALKAGVDQQRSLLAATYVMLSANVVDTAIAQAGYLAEIEATEASIALEKEQLRITQAQAEGGTAPF